MGAGVATGVARLVAVRTDSAGVLAKIDAIYPHRSAALKRAKVALADLV
jgi:hypothetical protein